MSAVARNLRPFVSDEVSQRPAKLQGGLAMFHEVRRIDADGVRDKHCENEGGLVAVNAAQPGTNPLRLDGINQHEFAVNESE
jgi:hypothetical protein